MMTTDPNAPLRRDVRLLGELLGDVLKAQVGQEVYQQVETLRQLSKRAFEGDETVYPQLDAKLKLLSPAQILPVVRAFSHFLNCANIAENVHRIRRTRWYQINRESSAQPGSLEATFTLLKNSGIEKEQLYQAILQLKIELVLTAHPTEVMRRTLIQKFDEIGHLLLRLDEKILTTQESYALQQALYREMTAIWQTDEIRRKKPTPLDEAKSAFAILETSLWHALPNYLRELEQKCFQATGKSLPLMISPIRFCSWIGGDRDGNPNVTAEITAQVCLLSRWTAADLYLRDINALSGELSMAHANAKLREVVGQTSEPYRELLRPLRKQLSQTLQAIEAQMAGLAYDDSLIIKSRKTLLRPLLLCYESLVEMGASCIAQGSLSDCIRRIACFGVSLLPLDIRQEASRHRQLMGEITHAMGLGDYNDWSEEQRQQFLFSEEKIVSLRLPENVVLSAPSQEVWDTLKTMARQIPSSLGAYVISMASVPSDILVVYALQMSAGIERPLRVVPLFETLADLKNAGGCMQQLFAHPAYCSLIKHRQEVMIGYSDSGKDAGILAAGWALYQAQESLGLLAQQYSVHLTLFHGRGGSIGRGGAPAHIAILSQPPSVLNGSLRVTEQGEVIRNKYGLTQRAQRSLELYTTATLQGFLLEQKQPEPQWRNIMDELAESSFKHYAKVVKDDPNFVSYFQQATPERELGHLAIGSRPARRAELSASLQSLRAIPWVFAWTQNRLLLGSWLGVGEALKVAFAKNQKTQLQTMRNEWPFFGSLLSMIEMVLAKTSPEISARYEQRLVDPSLFALGSSLRQNFIATVESMLELLIESNLLADNPVLARTLQLRTPYLYPLHVLQTELLWRVRHAQGEQSDSTYQDALLVTISGIAAGMQNTG